MNPCTVNLRGSENSGVAVGVGVSEAEGAAVMLELPPVTDPLELPLLPGNSTLPGTPVDPPTAELPVALPDGDDDPLLLPPLELLVLDDVAALVGVSVKVGVLLGGAAAVEVLAALVAVCTPLVVCKSGVLLGVGVAVLERVNVGVGVSLGVFVSVGVGVLLGVFVGAEAVAVLLRLVAVWLAACVCVAGGAAVSVSCELVAVNCADCVCVALGVIVLVGVRVSVGVFVGAVTTKLKVLLVPPPGEGLSTVIAKVPAVARSLLVTANDK